MNARVKLTKAQRDMLEWLARTDQEITDPAIVKRLVAGGLATLLRDDFGWPFFRITESGRAALKDAER